MRIRFDHDTTKTKAREKAENLLVQTQSRFGHMVKELEHSWSADVLSFSFRTQGMKIKGTVEITDTEVILQADLPLFAKPFEPKITAMLESQAKDEFRKA